MAAPGRPAATLPAGIEAAELPADAIEVGRIADAWGIKGWFKVLPHSADPQALFSSTRWYLQPSEKGPQAFRGTVLLRVRETKEHSDTVVARADGADRASVRRCEPATDHDVSRRPNEIQHAVLVLIARTRATDRRRPRT